MVPLEVPVKSAAAGNAGRPGQAQDN